MTDHPTPRDDRRWWLVLAAVRGMCAGAAQAVLEWLLDR
jgi:hypothetical protein